MEDETGAGQAPGAPPAGDAAATSVRTFLIADVRGYTRFTHERGDEEAGVLAARFAELARRGIEGHGGTLLELRGDEALGVFGSARDALRCAIDLQHLFREGDEGLPLGVGIGLDAGEAVPVEGGYRGGALNLAARLCSLAAPGEILASETVTSLARRIEGVRFEARGTERVKGLAESVKVVEVISEAPSPGAARPRSAALRRLRRRHANRRTLALAAAAVLVLGALVAAVATNRAPADPSSRSAGAAELDPESGKVLGRVPLGTSPSSVAVGEGSVWVIDADEKTVSQIDPETREVVRTFSTSSAPTDVAVGAGSVWIGNAGAREGLLPESVSRIDPSSGVVTATIPLAPTPLGGGYGIFAGPDERHIAVAPDAVWVIGADQALRRVDPRTNEVVGRVVGLKARNVAAGEGDVWVSDEKGLVEIDAVRNTVARRVPADHTGPLAIGAGAVWMVDGENEALLRVETDAQAEQSSVELGPWVAGVSFGEGAVWATSEIEDAVYRIDPSDGTSTRIEASGPQSVAAGEGLVWITTAAPPSKDAALPSAVCSDVYFEGDGEPDVLIVSDLTLKGAVRPFTQAMVEGMRDALEQRAFEAGPFSVGYQSCDSATAQASGLDFFRCAANAKAYARNLRVVAVFGSFQSPCSYAQIPITNEAEGGPLAMLSPSNTFEGLTIEDALYPTGRRSFFRLAAMNAYEAAAHLELARQLGHDRVYRLTSEWEEYGPLYDDVFRRTARRLGIDIVGASVFDHEAESYSALTRRIAKARPEAIDLAAVLSPGSGALVRELHAALGPSVPLLVPDGFRLIEDLVTLTGPAAASLYVTEYGVPNAKLPPRGRQFLDGFAAERGGDAGPDNAASYGAQGAEILLDAIARSDGTRASVLDEIRKTRIEGGILGDIAFDRRGDLLEAPVAVYRVKDDEFVPDRVVVVRPPRPDGP